MGVDRAIDAGAMRDRETARNRPARGRGGAALYGRNGLPVAAGSEGVSPLFDDPGLFLPLVARWHAGSEGNGRVAVIVVADHIDVEAAPVDRQILAPIIGHAAIGDRAAGIDRFDLVGAAA